MKRLSFIVCLLTFVWLAGCARAPIKDVSQAMRPTKVPENLQDDLGLFDFSRVLSINIERLKSYGAPLEVMRFGPVTVSREVYVVALQELVDALTADPSGRLFFNQLKENFEFYEVYGDEQWGSVFITSYFEPVIKGRRTPKKPYVQPLYGLPSDLVMVNLGEYARVFPKLRPYQEAIIEEKSRDGWLRGRLVKESSLSVVPYFTREEIDDKSALKNGAPVLCYVDPIDAFFLHIQGSGRVVMPDGQELRVGYAGQNGHPYMPIGKLLLDVIPIEKMSAQKIETHLRSLDIKSARKIMNANSSYIFFNRQEASALTSFGVEAQPGRTIATDPKYFPKGAMAYLEYEKPEFADTMSDEVREFKKSARFVLDQDIGGAIRGPHRVDLFWGRGADSARVSGVMRNPGRLYYILPKKRAL